MEGDKGKGGIGSGDEEVDCGVVEHMEDVAGAGTNQRVVEGGGKVDEEEGGGEYGATDDLPDGATG